MRQHIVYMTTDAILKRALKLAPCSTRALALEAGLSPALITLAVNGKRPLTAVSRTALVVALKRWSNRCLAAVRVLEDQPRKRSDRA